MLPLQAKYPQHDQAFRFARNIMLRSLLRAALGSGSLNAAARFARDMLAHDRRFALWAFAFLPGAVLFDQLGARERRTVSAICRLPDATRPLHFAVDPGGVRGALTEELQHQR